MVRVGAHVSIAGGVENAIGNQLDVGGNCGQIFTHSPQVWQDPTISTEQATQFREESDAQLDGPWVIHTSYLVNLCTPKGELREKSIQSMQREIDAAEQLGIPYVNVHLGAHTGAGVEGGLANAVSVLDELEIPESVQVLIETDAGSGTKLGGQFEEIATVLEAGSQTLGVCLDTAHTFSAGYDLSTEEDVAETVQAFDEVIGLEYLKCIHLNDSKHACGTNKDEHAHIGEGKIGVEGMKAIINHPDLKDLPFLLETPTENGKSFEWNINRVRELRE